MAVLNVNPTRMELTNLKRKLSTALKGHRLLKDKRDELMRRFLELIYENKELRLKVEEQIKKANELMAVAESVTSSEILDTALMLPKQEISVNIEKQNVMSVLIPKYTVDFKTQNENDMYSYGYAFTPFELDEAVSCLSSALPDMIRLAQVEKSCQLLADEIEKTRRRVNALEHVLIPQYRETIRYITMKLDENERSTVTRLMKVKDMMIKEEILNKEV